MADNLSHEDLIAQVAMNSKLTALEVEEALEVLSVIIQQTLQEGGSVDLLGVGTFVSGVEDRQVNFNIGQSLRDAVADPTLPVQIQRNPAILPGQLFPRGGGVYKHKVNVC